MAGIRRTAAGVMNRQERRPPGFRERPECVVLSARGATSAKPPVRIFVGTEPGQHRAERVFVWSVEQARDASRTYEIYLMADLAGFDRRRWLTGFTNYRFAIPHFAGGTGRAIYNDVDQMYLVDPAELFDLDMAEHGFLSISERDTSVMVMDCARVAGVWTLEAAQRERRKRIEARAAVAELWGPLPREWNARDEEYVAGRSKVVHFTTIHTQPWQPFPQRFVYQGNPVGDVWLAAERAADQAGYQVFTAANPSAEYRQLIAAARSEQTRPNALPATLRDAVSELLEETGAQSVLDYRLGAAAADAQGVGAGATRTLTRFAAAAAAAAAPPPRSADAVLCAGDLERIPEGDAPWLLNALFVAARRAVCLVVETAPRHLRAARATPAEAHLRSANWWLAQVQAASERTPAVRWRLIMSETGRPEQIVRDGGRLAAAGQPTVWVLQDHKAGHTTQSVGLAEALDLPYELKRLRFNLLNHLSNRMRGASALGLDKAASAPLQPPWPDLVISTGRRCAPVARWIAQQSGGRTRTVQLGRRGGETVDTFDLVVSCSHFRLPLHPHRMEIIAPLNAVNSPRLAAAADRWRATFAEQPRPNIVLVAGGGSARYRLDADTARRMGERARAFAESTGGTLFTITSPRTGVEATAALRAGLGGSAHLHEWRSGEADNPYLGYLALADAIVVTGESESMLAEAAATGHPLYIYQLPERPLGFRWLSEWIARRAESRPRKAKGTVRPQQGLEYLCARLIEGGLVRPPRRIGQLHQGLVDAGVAHYFGAPFDGAAVRPLREARAVAQRVRRLLGLPEVGARQADAERSSVDSPGEVRVAAVMPLRAEPYAAAGTAAPAERRVAQR